MSQEPPPPGMVQCSRCSQERCKYLGEQNNPIPRWCGRFVEGKKFIVLRSQQRDRAVTFNNRRG